MIITVRLAILGCLLGVTAQSAAAGKFNKKLSVGDPAPGWEALEGTDGKRHSLADLKDKDVVVVVFTCNTCPVASDYEDRLISLANEHAKPDSKVAVVAINVNTIKGDTLEDMKTRATKKKFSFPYLHDPSQQTARSFGANFTPEFFVLNKDRKVVYMGAMDDKSPPTEATKPYVTQAIAAALVGKKAEVGETSASTGCRIRFNPKKGD